ncbi:MAG: DUF1330 domain-containing protein [Arenicella sp.]
MKGYWIAFVSVSDMQQYQEYMQRAPAALAAYNARILARGGEEELTALEGFSTPPNRAVVFEFESYEQALACYHSPEYQQARQFRLEVANAHIIILKGA